MARAVEGDAAGDEAAAAERATLAAALMADGSRPKPWLAFLEHEEGTGGQPNELLRLYGWAVKTVARAGMSKNVDYLRLWVGYALQQMVESEEDARDTFRCLKAQHVGEDHALLYVAWALLESFSGNTTKADSILKKGAERGATPAEAIAEARAQLAKGEALDPAVLANATVEGPPDPPAPVAATPVRVSAAPLPEPQPSPMLVDNDDTITIRPASGRRGGRRAATAANAGSAVAVEVDDTVYVKPRAARLASKAAAMAAAQAPAAVAEVDDQTVMINSKAAGRRRKPAAAAAPAPAPAPAAVAGMVTPSKALAAATPAAVATPAAATPAAATPAAATTTPATGAPLSSAKKRGSLRRLGISGGAARRVRPGEVEPAAEPAAVAAAAVPMDIAIAPIAEEPAAEEAAVEGKRKLTPGKLAQANADAKAKQPKVAQALAQAPCAAAKPPVMALAARAATKMNGFVDAVGDLHAGVAAARQARTREVQTQSAVQVAPKSTPAAPVARQATPAVKQQPAPKPKQAAAPSQQQQERGRDPSPDEVQVRPKPKAAKAAAAQRLPFHEDDNSCVVAGVKYAKLECVGKGGSSKVYKVMAPNRKIYAMKRIKLSGRDAESAAGFLDEITLLKRLRGRSNIIQLVAHDVIKKLGLIFVVLEYGEIDLARLLSRRDRERNGALDENFVRLYWQQMLEAVQTIHAERIVHSDLKPANFLFVEGTLKLIDFGIAKRINDNTTSIVREGQVGTLNYMSPEAILSGNAGPGGKTIKVGRASDVWSLGCILYQMAYRRTPFSHLAFIQKLHAITDPNHKINFPELPNAQLVNTIKRCLDRNPSTRITMDELLADPFLNPAAAQPAPAAQPSAAAGGAGMASMSMEQLQNILAQVALAAPGAAVDGAALGKEIFRQLENGGEVDMDAAIQEVKAAGGGSATASAASVPPPPPPPPAAAAPLPPPPPPPPAAGGSAGGAQGGAGAATRGVVPSAAQLAGARLRPASQRAASERPVPRKQDESGVAGMAAAAAAAARRRQLAVASGGGAAAKPSPRAARQAAGAAPPTAADELRREINQRLPQLRRVETKVVDPVAAMAATSAALTEGLDASLAAASDKMRLPRRPDASPTAGDATGGW